jgi:hypothetical protein
MTLDLQSLNEDTRIHAVRELESDIADGSLYLSPRLAPLGRERYPEALRRALETGDDEQLARELAGVGHLNEMEARHTKKGVVQARVPSTAATTLAEGEFNRFYVRGLCLHVVESGGGKVEVYRARDSSWARAESEALIGTLIDAGELLEDLRARKGEEPTLLPQVNSGLSVRAVVATDDPAL